MIFTIAKATGWSEESIIWMPLRKSLQYLHAAWISDGVHTDWRFTTEQDNAEAQKLYERLLYLTRPS